MRNAIVDQILMERMNRRGGYDGRDMREAIMVVVDMMDVEAVITDGIMLVAEETDVMEITMKNALKMRMRNTSWKCKMVDVE